MAVFDDVPLVVDDSHGAMFIVFFLSHPSCNCFMFFLFLAWAAV
jgi:hypothetical protein